MISNSCVWQQNSPKNGVLASGWCGIENCCLPNISLNTPALYPPHSLILLASLILKTFTRPICFHLSRKKSQYYKSQQIDIFLKTDTGPVAFQFFEKRSFKKSQIGSVCPLILTTLEERFVSSFPASQRPGFKV